jgi:hypothetical protein
LPVTFDPAATPYVAPDARSVVAVSTKQATLYRRDGGAFVAIANWPEAASAQAVAVSREYVAIVGAGGTRVRVWRTRDASTVLDQPIDLGGVRDIALLDAPGRVALAARGPELLILNLGGRAAPQTLSLPQGAQ